jgi:hypothetical protein
MPVERDKSRTALRSIVTRALVVAGLGIACVALATCGWKRQQGREAASAPQAAQQALSSTPAQQAWSAAGVVVSPPATDGEFVRRVTLDLAGRIPRLAETKAFLADTRADKRRVLVEQLLASDEFADHWAEQLANLFLGTDLKVPSYVRLPFKAWLRDSLAHNLPWNELTIEQLATTGDVQEKPAIAYLWAQYNMRGVEGAVSTTARTILGVQLQCAQCHDHPFDKRYKRSDFYGFAALLAETRAARRVEGERKLPLLHERNPKLWNKLVKEQPLYGTPPKLFGKSVEVPAGMSRRQVFAQAVVKSPLFAKTTVNRTWWQLFGRGIADPWDDLGAESGVEHPPLLERLSAEFVAGGYDLKKLIREIALSEAYSRSSRGPASKDPKAAPERVFARASVRPMSSAQLLRSLYAATGTDLSVEARRGEAGLVAHFASRLRRFQFVFQDDEQAEVDRFTGTIAQALTLLNGDIVNRAGRGGPLMTLPQVLARFQQPEQRISELFLTAFSREPTPAELARYSRFVRERGDQVVAYEDLFSAILNSVEFVTNH